MPETFVPLIAAGASSTEAGAAESKVLSQTEAAVFEPLAAVAARSPAAKACARPAVTVQRQGEVVSAIRIECGCGQVIELACVY